MRVLWADATGEMELSGTNLELLRLVEELSWVEGVVVSIQVVILRRIAKRYR